LTSVYGRGPNQGRVVHCADVEATANLYEQFLGSQRDWADGDDISLRAQVAGHPEATVEISLHAAREGGHDDHLGAFEVDNVDAAAEALQSQGFTINFAPPTYRGAFGKQPSPTTMATD